MTETCCGLDFHTSTLQKLVVQLVKTTLNWQWKQGKNLWWNYEITRWLRHISWSGVSNLPRIVNDPNATKDLDPSELIPGYWQVRIIIVMWFSFGLFCWIHVLTEVTISLSPSSCMDNALDSIHFGSNVSVEVYTCVLLVLSHLHIHKFGMTEAQLCICFTQYDPESDKNMMCQDLGIPSRNKSRGMWECIRKMVSKPMPHVEEMH